MIREYYLLSCRILAFDLMQQTCDNLLIYACSGLNLLDAVSVLRDKNDEQLDIQCDVFYDELDEDDDEAGNAEPEAGDVFYEAAEGNDD